jgi:biotin carboxyl carrier protein
MKYITTIADCEYQVEIVDDSHVLLNGQLFTVDLQAISDQPVYSLLLDNHSYEAYVYPAEQAWQVLLGGRSYQALVEDEDEKRLRISAGSGVSERAEFMLKSPMPGLIVAVPVEEGQQVQKGEILIILESMKMQNELKAPRAGIISRVHVKPGDSVEQRQTLLTVV